MALVVAVDVVVLLLLLVPTAVAMLAEIKFMVGVDGSDRESCDIGRAWRR
jgi:hypothetical protein